MTSTHSWRLRRPEIDPSRTSRFAPWGSGTWHKPGRGVYRHSGNFAGSFFARVAAGGDRNFAREVAPVPHQPVFRGSFHHFGRRHGDEHFRGSVKNDGFGTGHIRFERRHTRSSSDASRHYAAGYVHFVCHVKSPFIANYGPGGKRYMRFRDSCRNPNSHRPLNSNTLAAQTVTSKRFYHLNGFHPQNKRERRSFDRESIHA
jgi:hypothetical protein